MFIFIKKTCFYKWRRGWDSNPRKGKPFNDFRDRHLRPLSHLSAVRRYDEALNIAHFAIILTFFSRS